MDTWDAYRSRRNIRDYADRPIDDQVLDRILDAGRRAPSAFNNQSWDFVVVAGHPALDDRATVWQGARHIARSAAAIALITPIEPDPDKARWAAPPRVARPTRDPPRRISARSRLPRLGNADTP